MSEELEAIREVRARTIDLHLLMQTQTQTTKQLVALVSTLVAGCTNGGDGDDAVLAALRDMNAHIAQLAQSLTDLSEALKSC